MDNELLIDQIGTLSVADVGTEYEVKQIDGYQVEKGEIIKAWTQEEDGAILGYPDLHAVITGQGYRSTSSLTVGQFGPVFNHGDQICGRLTALCTSSMCTSLQHYESGCNHYLSAQQAAVIGSIVMVKRGDCAFSLKAENAQSAGAIGIIILSTDEALFMMMSNDDPDAVRIPALLAGKDTTYELIKLAQQEPDQAVVITAVASDLNFIGESKIRAAVAGKLIRNLYLVARESTHFRSSMPNDSNRAQLARKGSSLWCVSNCISDQTRCCARTP